MSVRKEDKLPLITKVASVFSPGAPIDKHRLFAGRTSQVRDIINAMLQRGQHVIIYGERGVGKTSLVNVLSELLSEAGLQELSPSAIINCDGTDDFSSMWHKIFREIALTVETRQVGFKGEVIDTQVSLNQFLSEKVTPDDIRYTLHRIATPTFIIIDELDRIKEKKTTALLADTVKTLSDHSVHTTLVFVGVADSVDELIAEHSSIERSLVQVRMPRMSTEELIEILDKGLGEVNMTIDDKAKEWIAKLSQGLPHYTHLLGLHAAQEAIENGRMNIGTEDVRAAIRRAVDKAQQSIRSAYHKATSSPRETLYSEVLLACALAEPDELGYFAAADVREPMSKIMKKWYDIPAFSRHLNDFCEEKRGPILQKIGSTRRFRFRFINPLMQPFIILNGIAKDKITPEIVAI